MYDNESRDGNQNQDTKFKREVIKNVTEIEFPSRRAESPSKAIRPGTTKLYSDVSSFKAFKEMNSALIDK